LLFGLSPSLSVQVDLQNPPNACDQAGGIIKADDTFMRIAESVTFGGSGLDRAAHLRRDPEAIAAALARGTVLPVWRGKALMCGDAAGWLPLGHPVLALGGPMIFLGLDGDMPRFATDISDWSPEAGAEAVEALFFDPSVQTHPSLGDGWGFMELRGVMTRLSPRDAELVATAKALIHWHKSHRFCAACGAVSDHVQAGWQRTCPACGAHHFPRTDPVVIMLVTRGNSVLLGRSPGWPEGMYSLLAGFVEPGETLEAAVRREVKEEAGIDCGAVTYLASQPWPFPASLMFGARADALSEQIHLDREELEHALWVSREDLVTVMAGLHPVIKPARKGAIAHFILENWLADRLD
jgi:NAD+ diphosphatase